MIQASERIKVPFITVELGTDTDPLLFHLFAALAERRLIGERTRLALRAAKARGKKLGGMRQRSIENRDAAIARANTLAPRHGPSWRSCLQPRAAAELNRRNIATPAGGRWHSATVLRLRARINAPETPVPRS